FVVRHPVPECSFSGSAADAASLLENRDAITEPTGKRRARQTAAAAAADNDVIFGIELELLGGPCGQGHGAECGRRRTGACGLDKVATRVGERRFLVIFHISLPVSALSF